MHSPSAFASTLGTSLDISSTLLGLHIDSKGICDLTYSIRILIASKTLAHVPRARQTRATETAWRSAVLRADRTSLPITPSESRWLSIHSLTQRTFLICPFKVLDVDLVAHPLTLTPPSPSSMRGELPADPEQTASRGAFSKRSHRWPPSSHRPQREGEGCPNQHPTEHAPAGQSQPLTFATSKLRKQCQTYLWYEGRLLPSSPPLCLAVWMPAGPNPFAKPAKACEP